MHITNLKIRNWRNFVDAEMQFQRRAFFVGANASGKSNLLEVIKFLRDLAGAGGAGGGLQEAVRRRGGVSALRAFAARKVPGIAIEVALGDDENDRQWNYELEFNARKSDGAPVVVREIVRDSDGATIVAVRPDKDDLADPERLTQTALEQVAVNKTFRAIPDFLRSVRYLHVVPEIVREPRRSLGAEDPFGGDLIARINSTSEKTRAARLKRMEEALKIAVPQLHSLDIEVDKKGIPHLRAKYAHWRPQGAWQREEHFSDGTLRLLGLIWSLQERGGPLLLEEPELSLNSSVVGQLAPLIARATRQTKRQVIVTTHAFELLSNNVRADEAFLLRPTENGTLVEQAGASAEITNEIKAGIPLGEILAARTKLRDVESLPLLDLLSQ